MKPTPTGNTVPLRPGDFANLSQALDYAARGVTGCNFYTGKGELSAVVPYEELREQAQTLARRLQSLGLLRGARVALLADTNPDFMRFFFACQYAGLVPVPVPASIHLASRSVYVEQLRALLVKCQASVAVVPPGFLPFLTEAAESLDLRFIGSPEDFAKLPENMNALRPLRFDELAYLQFTSGSTRFPRGVMITQQAALNNLSGIIKHGLGVRPSDRCVSWLPFYHDMGLVGFVLGPVASQLSVDYLSPRDFAMRPRQWLSLIAKNRATISFSPTFGYDLCTRRVRQEDAAVLDLSSWRIAGAGAEMIHHESLANFAQALHGTGFDANAFMACYGMAECSLAVSFAPLREGLDVDRVDRDHLSERHVARAVLNEGGSEDRSRVSSFVNCGKPLPEYEVQIRNEQGHELCDRECGTIFLRGPSIMSSYFGDLEATKEVLSSDGWLNTGDIGYRVKEHLFITGRIKDLIIIKGRNIWPQDLEYLAEQQPEVRPGDASAFSILGEDGEELAVMVVQCGEFNGTEGGSLVDRLQRMIREELGINCCIELARPHTLPRTSSGKLSRSRTRQDFLQRRDRLSSNESGQASPEEARECRATG
ncbi:MAG TPA: fatty acyl-AMP ligase [Nitrospirales bacterium]|nr:fatty acyl-AMP ligase [Nitrospirales bacterium]